MKIYDSKAAIYKDFPIALKFGLDHDVSPQYYDRLLDSFAREHRATLTRFSQSVANYKTRHPTAAGFFVEVAVKGDLGQPIGTRLILLEHETGLEWFIPLASALANWLGPKVAEKAAGKALDAALEQVTKFMKNEWSKIIYGGVRIDHVEVRTEKKGVMRIAFSDFKVSQVKCLIKKFPSIAHLSECNSECFEGLLVAPPTSAGTPQAHDYY